ncbi:Aldo/keto reductase [Fistulina hepatica ATCC 64428]|uniref:Aldo/keto reductase n=1 Tax=Fistulina hepatica ATCC 64428 TaxID=1128425 RepID=A0A0D7ALF5_9AGAR|nr:Aldo/keto reductase [Fistulina hepatica ATCC 64428]
MSFTVAGKTVMKGFGLMGLTQKRNNPIPVDEAIGAMKVALDAGANFWNGGLIYGTPKYNSLHLLKAYFTKYPKDADRVVLNIKGGLDPQKMTPNGSEERVRRDVDYCNETLGGVKYIDVFECTRVDPNIPVEKTIEYLAELVKEGKIGAIGLCEARAETIHRAAKVHPIESLEVELSLWATEPLTNGVAAACAEHNIPLVAYAPLGHGFLTGQVRSLDDIPQGDYRRLFPRFQPDAFANNLKLVEMVEGIAKRKGCTPAQVGLAWVKALNRKPGMPQIIAIPGAVAPKRILENAHEVDLTDAEVKEIDTFLKNFIVTGGRYPPDANYRGRHGS